MNVEKMAALGFELGTPDYHSIALTTTPRPPTYIKELRRSNLNIVQTYKHGKKKKEVLTHNAEVYVQNG